MSVFVRATATSALASLSVAIIAGCSAANGASPREVGSHDAGEAGVVHGDLHPTLASLSVSASRSSSSLALTPDFSPEVHDYYVPCSSGHNALRVAVKASRGAESLILQPVPSPLRPEQTVSLTVEEGQAIVAAASNGKGTSEYWVRCLPHDFPRMRMVRHSGAGAAPPGYYLVGVQNPTSQVGGYATVLDGRGVPVWYHATPAGTGAVDVDVVVPGAISFLTAVHDSGRFEVHPLDGGDASELGIPEDMHELRALPNGNFLVLQSPYVSTSTGPLLGSVVGSRGGAGPNSFIRTCNVQELDPQGAVVWEWDALDHFDPAMDFTWPVTAQSTSGGAALPPDVFHCNSIDVDPANGNLLVSARNMDSVFYVERSSGKVLWKMGGADYTKEGAPYVEVGEPFHRQHDARLQPGWSAECAGGAGRISLFDDETGASEPARAVVYDVVVGGAPGGGTTCRPTGSTVAGTARLVWKREGSITSGAMGSFRISPDGSRVIGWGASPGSPPVVFTEVDEQGRSLLDFEYADGNYSYRAIKVPLSAFDLATLRSTSGFP